MTIWSTCRHRQTIGVSDAEIVTDNGYYSESNLAEFFLSGFDFVTLVKTSIKWVKVEIDAHISDFGSMSSTCPYDTTTHGITNSAMREFKRVRKYDSHLTGAKKGDEETFTKRVYLHSGTILLIPGNVGRDGLWSFFPADKPVLYPRAIRLAELLRS